jgi:hypothetical protein
VGGAIGQILPLAVGVAISPVPIIAVILMLFSARAKVKAAPSPSDGTRRRSTRVFVIAFVVLQKPRARDDRVDLRLSIACP